MALDVIFLVNGSNRSIKNFEKHKERFPYVKKFLTVLTGTEAYKAASKVSNTSSFYIVDHDYLIDDSFDFSFVPPDHDKSYVHSFKVTDLESNPQIGEMPWHHGVYLFSKASLRSEELQFKYLDIIASKKLGYDVFMIVYDNAGYKQNADVLKKHAQIKVVFGKTKSEALAEAFHLAETDCFYVVDCQYQVNDFDFSLRLYDYDKAYTHVWNCIDREGVQRPGGVHLFSRGVESFDGADFEYNFGPNTKFHDALTSTYKSEPTSIVFISYDEPNAEQNWQSLVKRFPHAIRVHGVDGILAAHSKAASIASTGNFFVVDGDTEIVETFHFEIPTTKYDMDHYVHIWKSRNASNGLEYGYGGVKLFHLNMFKDVEQYVDMTTILGDGVKLIDEVAGITRFNSSEFHAFRGAYREGTKLSSGIIRNQDDDESAERLDVWCNYAEGEYADYVLGGAALGREHGIANAGDVDKLQVINKFDEIYKLFRKFKMHKKEKELLHEKYNKIDTRTITNLTGVLYQDDLNITLSEVRDMLSFDELLSKFWLIDELNKIEQASKNMLFVEGGYGVLGNFMLQFYKAPIDRIFSTDINSRLLRIADALNIHSVSDGWKFKAVHADPMDINYEMSECLINGENIKFESDVLIAPHCEKLHDVSKWSELIPSGKLIVAQTNTYGDERPLEVQFDEFKSQLGLTTIHYADTLPCQVYDRLMVIGIR